MPLTAAARQSIDYDVLLTCLVEQISSVTGIPMGSVYADQPVAAFAQQPTQPLMTVHVANTSRYGFDGGEDTDTLTGPRSLNVSFNCYAESHQQSSNLMETWASALFCQSVRLALRKYNFSVWSAGPVMDMTEKYDTGFQPRTYMQAVFGATSQLDQSTDEIDSFVVNGQYGQLASAAPASDGAVAAGGNTVSAPASPDLAVAALVSMYPASGLDVSDSSLADGQFAPCIGLVIANAAGSATIQVSGVTPEGMFSGLFPASRYFLGNSGQITLPPLTNVRFVQFLGTAVSTSQLMLSIHPGNITRRV